MIATKRDGDKKTYDIAAIQRHQVLPEGIVSFTMLREVSGPLTMANLFLL
jgi:hypothetical protein